MNAIATKIPAVTEERRDFFSNPILLREFLRGARDRKTIFFAALVNFLLALILYILWPRTGIFTEANSNELLTIFLGTELTFMILLTAGFTASSITLEREKNTFVMLQTSLLTPGEILWGKLFGSLGLSFVLFLSTLPVTSLCALSGGISPSSLFKALSIVGAATIVYGLLGLAISSLCRRSYISLLGTYIGITILAGAVWLPSVLNPLESLQPMFLKLRALSPYEALFALQFAESYESSVIGASATNTYWIFMTAMGVMAVLFFAVFAKFIFAPPNMKRSQTVNQYTDTKTALKRKLGWPFYLIDPLKRKKPIASWRNPVFVAEIRSKLFGQPKFIIRALSACICLSICLLLLIAGQVGNTDLDNIRAAAIIFQLGVVALLAPTVSSGSISDEKISGTILLLRLTPMSPAKVIIGKMKAALLYVLIFLCSSMPVFLTLVYLESDDLPALATFLPKGLDADSLLAWREVLAENWRYYWRLVAWVGVLLTTCLALTSAGLCASCFASDTGKATAMSYGFALLVTVLSLSILLFGTRFSPTMQAIFLTFNPFVAALEITLDGSLASRLPRIFGNRLWLNHLYLFTGLTFLLLAISAWKVRRLFREQH
jgi:ABC-type transport system involved in multi-copper enzyme maturation permease subunit